MKKFLCAIFAVMLFLLAGCSRSAEEPAVLPPVRIGANGNFQASLANRYTFDSAFDSADAVARVKVGDWLGEEEDTMSTYFDADVLECYKGDMPSSITLMQDGCSAWTMKGYPLFTSGNEMLVFLKSAVGKEYENTYWIMGSFTTFLDVSYGDDGARYYADRYGILGETMDISANYANQEDVAAEVYATAAAADPIVEDMKYQYVYIFSDADVNILLSER